MRDKPPDGNDPQRSSMWLEVLQEAQAQLDQAVSKSIQLRRVIRMVKHKIELG